MTGDARGASPDTRDWADALDFYNCTSPIIRNVRRVWTKRRSAYGFSLYHTGKQA
jgi:hypothetical protein